VDEVIAFVEARGGLNAESPVQDSRKAGASA
jgi:hypothetical protein